jgi:hypothetical protein
MICYRPTEYVPLSIGSHLTDVLAALDLKIEIVSAKQ